MHGVVWDCFRFSPLASCSSWWCRFTWFHYVWYTLLNSGVTVNLVRGNIIDCVRTYVPRPDFSSRCSVFSSGVLLFCCSVQWKEKRERRNREIFFVFVTLNFVTRMLSHDNTRAQQEGRLCLRDVCRVVCAACRVVRLLCIVLRVARCFSRFMHYVHKPGAETSQEPRPAPSSRKDTMASISVLYGTSHPLPVCLFCVGTLIHY